MNDQMIYTTGFRDNSEVHQAIIKVTTYCNGFRLAKVIVDHEQHWALYDGNCWRLMANIPENQQLDGLILNHLKTLTSAISGLIKGDG